jgi:hypothetical protein
VRVVGDRGPSPGDALQIGPHHLSWGTLRHICEIISLIHFYNPHWARVVGYGPFSLYLVLNEGLCPSSGDIIGWWWWWWYFHLTDRVGTQFIAEKNWNIIKKRSRPRGQCARRTIAEAKQHWSFIGWVTNHLISRAPPYFGRHVKPLVPAVFAVVSTHQSALGPRCGFWAVLLVGDP